MFAQLTGKKVYQYTQSTELRQAVRSPNMEPHGAEPMALRTRRMFVRFGLFGKIAQIADFCVHFAVRSCPRQASADEI